LGGGVNRADRTGGMSAPTLYIDLASPYAYLATARIQQLFSPEAMFQPVLLGAIFQRRGRGSWAHTERREEGMAEVEKRARRYGLPPIAWPHDWPANSLAADRAATWAKQQDVADRFVLALYRRQFAHGEDVSELEVLASAAQDVGIDGRELLDAIQQPEVKQALRRATDEAWELGVRGVPTIRVDGQLFYGDDKLEEAAESLGRDNPSRYR
jgi:2-hydroxychromene-2-carboxylate isomerase